MPRSFLRQNTKVQISTLIIWLHCLTCPFRTYQLIFSPYKVLLQKRFASYFEGVTVHHVRNMCLGLLPFQESRKPRAWTRIGSGNHPQCLPISNTFLLVRPLLPNISPTSTTAPPAGYQVFKHGGPAEHFHTQTPRVAKRTVPGRKSQPYQNKGSPKNQPGGSNTKDLY